MKPKKRIEQTWRDLCAELTEDDGLTPDQYDKQDEQFTNPGTPKSEDRSTLRLCAQVAKALHLAMLADCQDPNLQALEVLRVEPYPGARRLRVHLLAHCKTEPAELNAKLQAVSHLLHHAVARTITRKRSPRLVFVIQPSPEQKGGADGR